MGSELSALTLGEFTSEMTLLMLRRDSGEGLSQADLQKLKDMSLALRPHSGSAGSPEERRQFLRVHVAGRLEVECEAEGTEINCARCSEIGIGGLLIQAPTFLPLHTRVRVGCLHTGDEVLELGVMAEVVRHNGPTVVVQGRSHAGMALCFVDLESNCLGRVKRVFDHLFGHAARSPGLQCRLTGGRPAIGDVMQLTRVCRTLLGTAGIDAQWTTSGPSEEIRLLLSANGRPLRVAQRVMLLLAWRLWTGFFDLRSTEFWHLSAASQKAAESLLEAVNTGFNDVDSWLGEQRLGQIHR